jgi:fatty acid desaturase
MERTPSQTRAVDLIWQEQRSMLWTIFVILLILWLVGFIGFHVIGWYIHLLLVVALVVLLIQLFSGRRPVV